MMDVERVNAYMERVVKSETETFKPVSDKLKVGVDLGLPISFWLYLTRKITRLPVKNRQPVY